VKAVAERLKRERLRQQLSQRALASLLNTSQSAICELETGATNPRLSTLERWAGALGLSVALLPSDGTTP
jgi:transcriptional regulator with XRE-family HTH domain